MPEDEDGMVPLHFQDEYYEDENNYYSGKDNTKNTEERRMMRTC